MAAKKYYGTDNRDAQYAVRVSFPKAGEEAGLRVMNVEIETRYPLPSNFRTELYALVAKFADPETEDNPKQIIP
jgi:hypothetical protein